MDKRKRKNIPKKGPKKYPSKKIHNQETKTQNISKSSIKNNSSDQVVNAQTLELNDNPIVKGSLLKDKSFIIGCFIVFIVTFLIYVPSFNNELTNWDDDKYVVKNNVIREINFKNIQRMFVTQKYYMGNYHPLTMLSLAIDFQFSDVKPPTDDYPFDTVNPTVFHFTNTLYHALNSAMVCIIAFLLFRRKSLKYSLIGAILTGLLFGVHTMHVESVAWVSERKDVLYTFFYLLSLIFYMRYIDKNKIGLLFISLFLFLLSCLSKGQAVTLAPTLLAVDYFYRRISFGSLFRLFSGNSSPEIKTEKKLTVKVIIEKAPFFILAITFGIVAIMAQQQGQAIHAIEEYSTLERIMIACYALTQYIWKLLIPVNLSAIYPYEYVSHYFPWYYFLTYLTAIGMAVMFFMAKSKTRFFEFFVMFFIFNIITLLQLIPVGSAIIADRYAYIPSIGFHIFTIFGLIYLMQWKKSLKVPIVAIFAVYMLFLSVLTIQRINVWRTSISLWDDVVEQYPIAVVAYNNRGSAKKTKGDFMGAIEDFSEAIRVKPDYKHAIYNRGTAKKDVDDTQGAIEDFDLAILLDPQFKEAYHNRGMARDQLNDIKGAIEDYTMAIQLNINDVKPYINRGVARGKSGDLEGAISDFNAALKLKPDGPDAYSNRGLAYYHMKNYEQALSDFNTSISIREDFSDAYFNRALTKTALSDFEGAIEDYSKSIQLKPNFATAYYQRGLVKFKVSDKNGACGDLQKAGELGLPQARRQFLSICK